MLQFLRWRQKDPADDVAFAGVDTPFPTGGGSARNTTLALQRRPGHRFNDQGVVTCVKRPFVPVPNPALVSTTHRTSTTTIGSRPSDPLLSAASLYRLALDEKNLELSTLVNY